MNRLTCLSLLLLSSAASADSLASEAAPLAPHANVGFEILGASGATSAGMRVHVGFDKAFGSGRGVRPSLGLGGTLGLASLSVEDPRALDGTVSIGHFDWGPEAQLGLRWVDGGYVDTRLFVSYAYLITDLDDRLMLDAIEGVGGTRGMRASLGASWADRQGRAALAGPRHTDDENLGWLIMFAPQQVEVTFERSAGSDRYGATLSWGL